jgi:hypothetical protein
VVGHVENLVEVGAKSGDLGLELVHAAAVPHVLGEMVQAVHPVVDRASDQNEGQRHQRHRPQRDAVDMEDRPAHVDRRKVAVAENGRGDPEREAHEQRARKQETLPEMTEIGHRPKVTRFAPARHHLGRPPAEMEDRAADRDQNAERGPIGQVGRDPVPEQRRSLA